MVDVSPKFIEAQTCAHPNKEKLEDATIEFMSRLLELRSLGVEIRGPKNQEFTNESLLEVATFGGSLLLNIDPLGAAELYRLAKRNQKPTIACLTTFEQQAFAISEPIHQLSMNLQSHSNFSLTSWLLPAVNAVGMKCSGIIALIRRNENNKYNEKLANACDQVNIQAMALARLAAPSIDFDKALQVNEVAVRSLSYLQEQNGVRGFGRKRPVSLFGYWGRMFFIPFGDAEKLWRIEQRLQTLGVAESSLRECANDLWDISRSLNSCSVRWLERMHQLVMVLRCIDNRSANVALQIRQRIKQHLKHYRSHLWMA